MKTSSIALAVTLALAGCATTDYSRVSSMQLCNGLMTLPSWNIHHGDRMRELDRRGENCSQYGNVAAAQAQADQNTLILLQSLIPPPPQLPQTTTCYRRSANGSIVICQ